MTMKTGFFDTAWKAYLALFLLSFAFYFIYYRNLILDLNGVLFQPNGDSLKNYYTYLYHIKNDKDLFQFSGMNFPFGEHIVYTDCQPLLTFILKLLPFAQGYAIGIMHFLILFSFMITPMILYRVFAYFNVNKPLAFFSSLAIAMLSPQVHRIGGHFGMAYGCVIPIAMLLLLRYYKNPTLKKAFFLFLYNCGLFLMHPYLGLGGSMFCFLAILLNGLFRYRERMALPAFWRALLAGALPMLLFNIFLALTDRHTDRTPEPYGIDIMAAAANFESVFTPSFGPFDLFLKKYIHSKHVEWEALSYIGLFPMCLAIITLLGLPFYFRRVRISPALGGLSVAALLLLVFAFGVHVQLLESMHIKIDLLNQFRCLGRYAWFFYFMLPVFLVTLLSDLLQRNQTKLKKAVLTIIALLFFSINLLEAHHLMVHISKGNFEAKNVFDETRLTEDEKSTLEAIRNKRIQAIVPFPLFYIGSDVYQKNGEESFLPALLYSYHARLPILGEVLSRTSVKETEIASEILNRYKQQREILQLTGDESFLVIKAGGNQREDELRVLKTLVPFQKYSDLEFMTATKADFTAEESEKSKFISVPYKTHKADTSNNILFIPFSNRKPFIPTTISDYQVIAALDSNTAKPGDYTVSFHYYLAEKKFRYIYNHLIVIKSDTHAENWEYFNSIRSTSGFYDGFIVYEQKIRIAPHFKYQFVLNGSPVQEHYRISHFLLKPEREDIKMLTGEKMLYNNYPD